MNLERKEFGVGETCLIMLHGNSLDPTIFNPLIDELKGKLKIITLCLPGHGNSQKPDKYSIESLSETIINNINCVEVKKYVLAHSLSGHLVLQGLQKLKNVSGVICVGTPPLGNPSNTITAFTRLGKLMNNAYWTQSEEKKIIDGLSKNQTLLLENILRKSDPDFREAITTSDFLAGFANEIDNLNETNIPVHLIYSTDDEYVDLSYCTGLTNVIKNPNVKINFIDYGGHLPFFNFPADFCKIIETATKVKL